MEKRVGYKRYTAKLSEFYCFLDNNFSIELYPTNKPYNFICELEPISLYGQWSVALTQLSVKYTTAPSEPINLLSRVVDDSPSRIANYHQNSILRRIALEENATSLKEIYCRPYYISVGVSSLERIPIELVHSDGSYVEDIANCHVTLHFKRDE